VVAISGGVFLANTTNYQLSEFPIWGALGWILGASCMRQKRAGLLAAAGFLIGFSFSWQPWASLPYAFLEKKVHLPRTGGTTFVQSFSWTGMPMRYFPSEKPASIYDPSGSAAAYANWLNDGLDLLARQKPHPGKVLCLDWSNPFPFALGLYPLIGDQVAWHIGRYMGPNHHPNADNLLSQADAVMEPKKPYYQVALEFKEALFAQRLKSEFTVVGESSCWKIWMRDNHGLGLHR
jgi:hypothetical protein